MQNTQKKTLFARLCRVTDPLSLSGSYTLTPLSLTCSHTHTHICSSPSSEALFFFSLLLFCSSGTYFAISPIPCPNKQRRLMLMMASTPSPVQKRDAYIRNTRLVFSFLSLSKEHATRTNSIMHLFRHILNIIIASSSTSPLSHAEHPPHTTKKKITSPRITNIPGSSGEQKTVRLRRHNP